MAKINQEEYEALRTLKKTGFTEVIRSRELRYSIADLIEEYESDEAHKIINRQFESLYGESEETEVKKLKGIRSDFENKLMQTLKGKDPMLKIEVLNTVSDLFNQLDEPELPVIPKFVAEYLALAKRDVPLMRVLELANTRNELPKWEKGYDWISENDETFARAWLDGYTVEKEQKYVVRTVLGTYLILDMSKREWDYTSIPPHAYKFNDRSTAEGIAKIINGEVEEMEE